MLLNRKINNQEQVANEWSRLWVNFDILVLSYIFGGGKKEKLSETDETWESDAWELNEANHDFSLFLIFYFIFYFFCLFRVISFY